VRLLLDSQVLVLAAEGAVLPARVQALLDDVGIPTYVSVASLWELTIKVALGKLALPETPEAAVGRMRAAELPIRHAHLARLRELPHLHKDPFDRMLVAQAIEEGLTLVTGDEALHRYPVAWLW
jgi:PIN domain nuclease of toxin-antitoxin system